MSYYVLSNYVPSTSNTVEQQVLFLYLEMWFDTYMGVVQWKPSHMDYYLRKWSLLFFNIQLFLTSIGFRFGSQTLVMFSEPAMN